MSQKAGNANEETEITASMLIQNQNPSPLEG